MQPPSTRSVFFALSRLAAALVLAAAFVAQVAAATPSFTALGFLTGGRPFSRATNISADGSTVVGNGLSASAGQAFRWTAAGGMEALPIAGPATWSQARAVSADGSVVVGELLGPNTNGVGSLQSEAFRWSAADGTAPLGHLTGGGFRSEALGVSADGSVVVGASDRAPTPGFVFTNEQMEAFRWTQQGGMVGLGLGQDPNGGTFAMAVSANGSIVVGQAITNSPSWPDKTTFKEAFRWTSSEGMVGLGHLTKAGPAVNISEADVMTPDGSLVIGFSTSDFNPAFEIFRWTAADGMSGLGNNPVAFARDVSADGQLIIADDYIWDAQHGFRVVKDLLVHGLGFSEVSQWSDVYAAAISDDGRWVAGYGTNPDGVTEAWLAFADDWKVQIAEIPEPSTGLLVLAGLLGLAARRRGRA